MQGRREEAPIQQNQFYQEIASWKEAIRLISQIIWYVQEEETYQIPLKQLAILIKTATHKTSEQSENAPQEIQHSPRGVQRMLGSIEDHIHLVKQQNLTIEEQCPLIYHCLTLIQREIAEFKHHNNSGKLVFSMRSIFSKYTEAQQEILDESTDRQVTESFMIFFNQQSKEQIEHTSKGGPRQESTFQKIIAVVNKRYTTLNCLDIDYNSYKSHYFQSRNQQEELLKQYSQRNHHTAKTFNIFCKQFKKYQNRCKLDKKKNSKESNNASRAQSLPTPDKHPNSAPVQNKTINPSIGAGKVRSSVLARGEKSLNRLKKTISQQEELQELMQQQMESIQQIQEWKKKTNYHINKIDLGINKGRPLPGYVFNHCIGSSNKISKSHMPPPNRLCTPMRTDHLIPTRRLQNSPTPSKGFKLVQIAPKSDSKIPSTSNLADALATITAPNSCRNRADRSTRIQKYMSRRIDKKGMTMSPYNNLVVLNVALAEQHLTIANPEL